MTARLAGPGGSIDVVDRLSRELGRVSVPDGVAVTNLPGTQPVSGTVDVGNLPATQPVSGEVEVGNFPATQPISGTVEMSNPTADPETGLAKDATLGLRFLGGKTPVVATVTSSGDNTIHSPASGKRIRLTWIQAMSDPDEATTPLIRVLLGADEVYRVFALSHWEPFLGDTDAPLVVNLSAAGSVAVTAHLEEVD